MNVDITAAGAILTGAADLTSFAVRPLDVSEADFTAVLRRDGAGEFLPGTEFPGGHVLVRVDWLRAAAAAQDLPPEWDEAFAGMLRYAAREGWTSPDGTTVRGHVVQDPHREDPAREGGR